jgi:SAM-dependent methyltransferase
MLIDYVIKEAIVHLRKMVRLSHTHGIIFVARLLAKALFGFYWYSLFKSRREFLYQGRRYKYYYHPFNATWMSERAVEIPIIRSAVSGNAARRCLELGNVLSHYFKTCHDVVDKHESGKNVINQDIVDYRPDRKYDLIVSISTIEHVGWDEHLLYRIREPDKIKCALGSLKRILASNGEMIVTYPVGYNPHLDQMTDSGELEWLRVSCMKRISEDNTWIETDWRDIKNAQYDKPFISANGLVIASYKNNGEHVTRRRL